MVAFPQNPSADVTAIKQALLGDLDHVVKSLFPSRKIQKLAHEFRVGTYGSLSIRLPDGVFCDHETTDSGDIIGLIQYALKTDFKSALAWAKAITGKAFQSVSVSLPHISMEPTQRNIRAARQRDKAFAMLVRSRPIKGTLAEHYLRKHRIIQLAQFPEDLRFIENAYNFSAKGFFPALIAVMRDLEGNKAAAHLTFLDPITAQKISGEDVKSRLIFGPCRGAAIRLGETTEKLALCEGVEDGLSILQSTPDWSVWVTGGTSGLRSIQVPSSVQEVLICGDRDEAGIQAANVLASRLTYSGKKVRIAFPPEGVKDFNDLLRKDGGRE